MREILDKLSAEIRELEHELRIELPKEIKTALAHGDLRENSEYHAALERQRFLQARIQQLRERVGELSSLDMDQLPRDRAALGSTVTVLDLDTDEEFVYRLVLPEMADLAAGLLSVQSPIGRGFVGKKAEDEVTIRIPTGVKRFELLELKTVHDEG